MEWYQSFHLNISKNCFFKKYTYFNNNHEVTFIMLILIHHHTPPSPVPLHTHAKTPLRELKKKNLNRLTWQ